MNSFEATILRLVDLVTSDSDIESVWLSIWSKMEFVAAEQILRNIVPATPENQMNFILNHIKEEQRHGNAIWALRPHTVYSDLKYYHLEVKLMEIVHSFVMGYFNNPILQEAKNPYVAYVHGAMTIEQFPVQVYSAYIQATSSKKIKNGMAKVLSDEAKHLSHGRQMFETLAPEERLPVDKLMKIEEQMAHLMVYKMAVAIEDFLQPQSNASLTFEQKISQNPEALVAWVYALAHAEAFASKNMAMIFDQREIPRPAVMAAHISDELRHCKMLQDSVAFARKKLLLNENYCRFEKAVCHRLEHYLMSHFSFILKMSENPEVLYYLGAIPLETRVLSHYQKLSEACSHVGVSYTIDTILEDETRHSGMAKNLLQEATPEAEALTERALRLEERFFQQAAAGALKLWQEFLSTSTEISTDASVNASMKTSEKNKEADKNLSTAAAPSKVDVPL